MAKRILIFGVGSLGQTVARNFLKFHEFDVELVDREKENLELFSNNSIPLHVLDLKNQENMRNLEIKDKDICLVLIGEDIASSVLTCQNLIDFNVFNIFVRVINEQHQKIISSLGISNFIDPNEISAKEIINKVCRKSDFYEINPRYGIIFVNNLKINKKRLCDLSLQQKYKAKIFLIVRPSNKEENIIPTLDTKIETGDKLAILCPKENTAKIIKIFRN